MLPAAYRKALQETREPDPPYPLARIEDVKVVLAESLGKFLEWIAGLLESGNLRRDE